jgi:hypothetical protein
MSSNASGYHTESGSALTPSLLKLVEVIEEENAALKRHDILCHAGFTDRKNQILREVMAAQRSEDPRQAAQNCKGLLERLSAALRTNAALLKLHIGAVGEMSDIIISGLRAAESDGTYSRNRTPRG